MRFPAAEEPVVRSGVSCGHLGRWWLLPNLLALDAPIVAVTWCAAFGWAFDDGSTPDWPVMLGLFLAVWVIYLADRLIDVRCMSDPAAATRRHGFAGRRRRSIGLTIALAIGVGSWLAATRIDPAVLRAAALLAIAVAIYFGGFVRLWKGRTSLLPAKEIACGVVFAVGCAIGVDGVRANPMAAAPPVILLGAVCALNCLLIAGADRASDAANDRAAATGWWRRLDSDLYWIAPLLVVAGAVGWRFSADAVTRLYAALTLAALGLLALHALRRAGRIGVDGVRVLADAVLLTPLVIPLIT